MMKILIYLHEGDLKPAGGPNGYNYYLREGLLNGCVDANEIIIKYLPGKSSFQNANDRVKKIKSNYIKQIVTVLKSICKKGMMLYGPVHRSETDLDEYDIVHFHETMDMYWTKDSLKKYRGKVILTSHTPTKPSKEIFDRLSDFEKMYLRKFYSKLDDVDDYAFRRADYIIFPCEEAEEPYFHNWNGYSEIKCEKASQYRYIPTGTIPLKAKRNRTDIRKQYEIPEDAFLISYVGRHNEIKGYSDLKKIGEKILSKYTNAYFIIAGREGPIYGLDNDRWIEVGWTDDPGSIINASDLFILPNRETYFDLVMLEVLSIGQIILATKSGGNKYFERFKDCGICLYETEECAISGIEQIMNMNDEARKRLRAENQEIYRENFGVEIFAKNYYELLKQIAGE